MIKVAIVEDEPSFRRSLRRVIESNPAYACTAVCASGAEALKLIPDDPPQVVLMDLNLPDKPGAEVTSELKNLLPELNVIILTVYNDADSIFNALRSGASGYMLKQATAAQILQAVDLATQGGAPMTNEIARKVIHAFHQPSSKAGTPSQALAPREREILELVAEGYSNKEIADKLNLTTGTVCWYLHAMYRKLHVQSRVQAVRKLRRDSGP